MTISNDPKDPVFYSTCFERVMRKIWMPDVNQLVEDAQSGYPYSFYNGTICLSCDAVRANVLEPYNYSTMPAVQWWMQLQRSVTMALSEGRLGPSWIEQTIAAMSTPWTRLF